MNLLKNKKNLIIIGTVLMAISGTIFCVNKYNSKNKELLSVVYNGQELGVYYNFDDETIVKEAVSEAIEQLKENIDKDNIILNEEPEVVVEPTSEEKEDLAQDITEDDELSDKILAVLDEDPSLFQTEAYKIIVDGEVVAYADNELAAEQAMETILEPFINSEESSEVDVELATFDDESDDESNDESNEETEIIEVGFVEEIEVEQTQVSYEKVLSYEDIEELLNSTREVEKIYNLQEGDNLWDVANMFDTTTENIIEWNDDISEDSVLQIDQEIIIVTEEPLVSIQTIEEVESTETIPYESVTKENSNQYTDYSKVTQEGVEGEKNVVKQVTKINGIIVDTEIISEEVISEPIEEVVEVGTKTKITTGTFIYPVSGTLTSTYGYRWGGEFHSGIDLAVPIGTPVKAADGGTVTFSGWRGNYGYLVIIDHDNGYQTYYAHNDSLPLSVGTKVGQGDIIAYSGNTGRSTGPHVHFEIRKNGSTLNPLNYLP